MVNIVARLEHAFQHLFSSGVCKCVVEDTVHGSLFFVSLRTIVTSIVALAFDRRVERSLRLLVRV